MICSACKQETPGDAAFCPKCGQRVGGAVVSGTTAEADRVPTPSGAAGTAEPERELWAGTFSPKSMYGSWVLAAVVTVAGIVLAVVTPIPPVLIAVPIGVLGLWLALAVVLIHNRFGTWYSLTTQRFLHQQGLFSRENNRILLIDIEDVSFKQKFIERFLNVGTITLIGADVSNGKLIMNGIDNVERVTNMIDDARREERRKRAIILQQHDPNHAT
jgi:uncharacterized membrane protein YdbT with pleckstrin-like domain